MDMNELLVVGERAWKPRDPENDPDRLDQYSYDKVSRHIFSSSSDHDEAFEHINKLQNSDEAMWGPKLLLHRLKSTDSLPDDFAKTFPKTHAHFCSGKFRWFSYKKKVLRVLVGRGVGPDNRGCTPDQEADVVLLVSASSDVKKLVTALAIVDENGRPILYSGHDDGILVKWSLDKNEVIWSKQIYVDGTKEFDRCTRYCFSVREVPGVAGLVVRRDPENKG
jgi:hypothetical protein